MNAAATDLSARELVVVTGKGGVGKSAVAAALGRALAARRRVLVLEIDPRETVHQMFELPPSGGDIVTAAPRLFLQNLRATRVLDELVEERLRLRAVARRVLASPVYQQFVGGGPGLKQLAVLGHALRLIRGLAPGAPALDTVILDAPATGHGLSLLAAPGLVAEVIRKGPIGELTREVAALVGDPARTAVVAVTLAEEMPVSESLELAAELETALGRRPELLAVNALYPPLAGRADDAASRLWKSRRKMNEGELERLDRRWPGPRVELPLWPLERGPGLVDAMAAALARSVLPGEGE